MIITRTPFRLSLFGGGTDYPSYYRTSERGGAVLGLALDRYCYLTVRRLPPFFAHRHRIVYSRVETVGSVAEIQHPTTRAVLSEYSEMIGGDGLEIHHDGDLPARSGLGSSSSFVVGLIAAINALYGRKLGPIELWREAVHIERDVAGETVGSQDQAFAAFGGLRRFEFSALGGGEKDDLDSEEISLSAQREADLTSRLMLVFTGITRLGSVVAEAQRMRVEANRHILDEMRQRVYAARAILIDPAGEIDRLGAMLHEGWLLKRSLSHLVSNDYLDTLYAAALHAGTLGGKILGAGGGGFLCLWVPLSNREAVRAALRERIPNYVEVPVRVALSGCAVVLEEPNGL